MGDKKDIGDFNEKVDVFKNIGSSELHALYNTLESIRERSLLYLEFLAGAFLSETGLKASEAELVQFIDFDGKVHWYFQKREKR
jgi:hypothetical protein